MFIFMLLLQMTIAFAHTHDCKPLLSPTKGNIQQLNRATTYNVVKKIEGPKSSYPGWIVWLDNGIKAYFKPLNETLDLDRFKHVYQSPYHEVAAYKLSEYWGFHVVPETIMTTLNDGNEKRRGSLQLYVEGATATQFEEAFGILFDENDAVWLFDKLIGNIDRSGGNYIIVDIFNQVAIDNSSSFFLINFIEANIKIEKSGPTTRNRIIKTLQDNPHILEKIQRTSEDELTVLLHEELLQTQIQYVYDRLMTLLRVTETMPPAP